MGHFSCDKCDKAFPKITSLRAHKKIHFKKPGADFEDETSSDTDEIKKEADDLTESERSRKYKCK